MNLYSYSYVTKTNKFVLIIIKVFEEEGDKSEFQ